MAQLVYNTRLFNPLFWHLQPLLKDESIRYLYVEGGSSAAKTFEICDALLLYMLETGRSVMVFRRFRVHIKDSVYQTFKKAAERLEVSKFLRFQEFTITYPAKGARIRFRGLDDEENIKGIEDYDIIFCNEWSQQTENQWDQLRKRLRGRANQKFVCDWNPISSQLWHYQNWIDKDKWTDLPLTVQAPTPYSSLNAEYSFKRANEKGNSVWIKTTYRDNYWIVGHPSGKGGFVDQDTLADYEHDRIHKPNLYRVYANGERGVIRTGGEFWKQFNELVHVKPLKYEGGPLHISLDENVNPYVTIGVWQYFDKNIRQIHELPCKVPDNNAPKSAKKFVDWLNLLGFEDVVFVYGDPSADKRSTVDENSASFYDKFIAVLRKAGVKVIKRVKKSAPEVALSAAFINEIYESNLDGYSITIGDSCKISIDDYMTVKEDKDGSMFKPKVKDEQTNVTYEPHGHFSDQKRYFITTILEAEFNRYKAREKKLVGFST